MLPFFFFTKNVKSYLDADLTIRSTHLKSSGKMQITTTTQKYNI
ncbi:hypothetical protein SeHA_A0121 (plasmid) [Salmonella enterica subsp. enterica serovar Heidelberg str. SL476]|uniref:Uncharacterized protein n=3 Tax=Enterobacteriaceae TaxID=543 RepID=A0A075MCG3_ECOLX|nr:hypothetical protein SeHA_A0121 [Salmonella enterica subsp. enterica serovar Heidelberg str. SL476]AFU34839.1 hypothetical protein pSH146_87_113 [Salmonella enterica subsp. enterica serovar Heidelberg]AIF78455.1 hypothetical protein [Escherichia coli]AIF78937.1 hypothetical protein [Escherichia coli]ATZ30021.1 hypothetical protein CV83915_2p0018 [Escherichia coli]